MVDLRSDEARVLLDVAVLAIGHGFCSGAAEIISALESVRPGNEQLAVARMVLMLNTHEYEMAVEFADSEGKRRREDSGLIKVFKGLALLRLGRSDDARRCLSEVKSENRVVMELAKGLMEHGMEFSN